MEVKELALHLPYIRDHELSSHFCPDVIRWHPTLHGLDDGLGFETMTFKRLREGGIKLVGATVHDMTHCPNVENPDWEESELSIDLPGTGGRHPSLRAAPTIKSSWLQTIRSHGAPFAGPVQGSASNCRHEGRYGDASRRIYAGFVSLSFKVSLQTWSFDREPSPCRRP